MCSANASYGQSSCGAWRCSRTPWSDPSSSGARRIATCFGSRDSLAFFFQAEDGIRAHCVTGVQTCALPILLGRIDPASFSGGEMRLDADAAERAIAERIGIKLSLAAEHAAFGVSEMVDENMANAARVHAIESGKDLRPRTLIAFGGAAPLHAARVAEKLGISRVLVPVNAGVGSAVGLLRAPVAYETVRGRLMRLGSLEPASVNRLFAEMRAEAEAIVRRGAPATKLVEQRSAFMRYRGQGHEIAVALPVRDFTAADRSTIRELFEAVYRRLYSRAIPE